MMSLRFWMIVIVTIFGAEFICVSSQGIKNKAKK